MEAKQVKDLMEAYASVYNQPERQEVLSEDPVQDYRDRKRDAENKAGVRGPELSHGGSSKGTPKPGLTSIKKEPRSREFAHGGSTPRSREFAREGKEGVETQTHIPPMKSSGSTGGKSQLPKRTPENAKKVEYYKDDVDLFDLVKGHLVDEGFADTEEAALVIMANMSEEWRESNVESIARGSAPNSPTGTIGGAVGRVAGPLLQRGVELLKKNMPQSGGGYSTRPGDGKPYKDGPLWGPGSSDAPVRKPTPQRKPQGAPMRDEPLW